MPMTSPAPQLPRCASGSGSDSKPPSSTRIRTPTDGLGSRRSVYTHSPYAYPHPSSPRAQSQAGGSNICPSGNQELIDVDDSLLVVSRRSSDKGRARSNSSPDGSVDSTEDVHWQDQHQFVGQASTPTRPRDDFSDTESRLRTSQQPTAPFVTPRGPPDYAARHDFLLSGANFDWSLAAPGLVHAGLQGHCDFVRVPQWLPTPLHWPRMPQIDSSAPNLRAFIGQAKFETTPEQMAFILQHACGVVPSSVVTHRVGCFVVHFADEAALTRAVAFHKRVYFDITGVWVARTADGVAALSAEALSVSANDELATNLKRCRLPRSAIVIEPFTDEHAGSPKRLQKHSAGESY